MGIATQRRIGAFLARIDDKIELNTAINENLEQQAQAIFKAWFVDFEPFGGVMPEDWNETTLGTVATISTKSLNPIKNPNLYLEARGYEKNIRTPEILVPDLVSDNVPNYLKCTIFSSKKPFKNVPKIVFSKGFYGNLYRQLYRQMAVFR